MTLLSTISILVDSGCGLARSSQFVVSVGLDGMSVTLDFVPVGDQSAVFVFA